MKNILKSRDITLPTKVHLVKAMVFPVVTYGCAAAAKSLQSCPTLRPHRRQATRLPRPWDSSGKNIGVGCHFLLQCMEVKHESEVAQSCPTLLDPMDCSLPGFSIHGIFQARVLEWDAIAFSNGCDSWTIKKAEQQRIDAFLFFFFFFFISWRLITLQYCSGFCHTLK